MSTYSVPASAYVRTGGRAGAMADVTDIITKVSCIDSFSFSNSNILKLIFGIKHLLKQ